MEVSTGILHEHEPTGTSCSHELQESILKRLGEVIPNFGTWKPPVPKLLYADIIWFISIIFSRVNLETLSETESEMWWSSNLPSEVLYPMSQFVHKQTAVPSVLEETRKYWK